MTDEITTPQPIDAAELPELPKPPEEKEPSGAERRRQVRKTLKGRAYILFAKRDPIAVRTLDISTTGLCIVVPLNPPLKLTCGIRFAVPIRPQGNIVFECQASVIYSVFSNDEDGFKVGLHFANPSEAMTKAIAQFIG